ncbi:MAG: Asp-tRNA(Asn)/Glu-tRNA(Gln) amidotransferase subunit GatC [Candidatus Portnoybacteria bacterium]
MAKLTKKEVEHVAKLARLGLTGQEKEKLTKELSAILDFFEKLNEVKTDKIEPTAQVTGLENVSRQDKGRKKTERETQKLLDLAPEIEERRVKVKAVL